MLRAVYYGRIDSGQDVRKGDCRTNVTVTCCTPLHTLHPDSGQIHTPATTSPALTQYGGCVLRIVKINASSVSDNNVVSCNYVYILPHKTFIRNL